MMHGKRLKTVCNLSVFPKGYYSGSTKVKSLAFIADVKKGIWNGAAQVIINGKKWCNTRFADQIEIVSSIWPHPVGRHNLIDTDLALLNCFLSFGSIVCICLSLLRFQPHSLF